jgi:signal transduction histidine kinase
MEAGKLSWTNQPFNLHATIQEAVGCFHHLADERGVTLATNFDPAIDQLSPIYVGDKARTLQVVKNLLRCASSRAFVVVEHL